MELNREITQYCSSEDQAAFEAMQRAAFRIADVLMAQPQGSLALINDAEYVWVQPYRDRLEVVVSQDMDVTALGATRLISDIEGLGADDLNDITGSFEAWLANPVYRQMNPADLPERVFRANYND